MNGESVRSVFEAVLPDAAVEGILAGFNFQERCRRMDALLFIRAMVMAAGTNRGGRQADVMRLYFENGGPQVVRGGFYRWFNPKLEAVMEQVAVRALVLAREKKCDLPGWLGEHVSDWLIVDSSTLKLEDELKEVYPGTGDYAAVKVHKVFSVGVGTTVGYHLSAAKDHDNKHFQLDEGWRGKGLLADLGYASFKLVRDCNEFGVKFVIRLKDSWKPKVRSVSRGNIKKTFFPGQDFDVFLENDLVVDGQVIDLDVALGKGKDEVHCRLSGICAKDGTYRFYLTNLPSSVGPRQISDLYRVRWEIESDNKLNKSCFHIDEIRARTGSAVRSLIHAAITSSIIACLIVHDHRLEEAPPPGKKCERTKAPIHPQLVARAIGSACMKIAELLGTGRNDTTDERWEEVASLMHHLGKDPNWRRRPSILDQLRGWKIQPGRAKNARITSKAA